MLSFIADELVWATIRDREEEARRVRPHTEREPEARGTPPPVNRGPMLAFTLRRGSLGPGQV
jgi:hypothetical protein